MNPALLIQFPKKLHSMKEMPLLYFSLPPFLTLTAHFCVLNVYLEEQHQRERGTKIPP